MHNNTIMKSFFLQPHGSVPALVPLHCCALFLQNAIITIVLSTFVATRDIYDELRISLQHLNTAIVTTLSCAVKLKNTNHQFIFFSNRISSSYGKYKNTNTLTLTTFAPYFMLGCIFAKI